MKKILVMVALATAFAGCQKEAEKFGYKGADLEETENSYLMTQAGVTNWLPARVLSVREQYELSADEENLIQAAGVVSSGESLKEIPEGFQKREVEPWFVTWVKDTEAFGFKGVSGFLSHFDEDAGVWQVGEVFFSTYWDDFEKATAAASEIEKQIVARYHPLKIHRLSAGFLAEYRRLRVIVMCGPRATGDFACMFTIQDKNRPGCGPWEPISDQQDRINEIKYMKELKIWGEAANKVLLKNHEKVEGLRKSRGLDLFGTEMEWFDSGDGVYAFCKIGEFDPKAISPRTFAEEKVAEVARLTGTVAGEIQLLEKEDSAPDYFISNWQGELYKLRVDVIATGAWRVICMEVLQLGFELPPRPTVE